MDLFNLIAKGEGLAAEFSCFEVNFPTMAEYGYGAWLRKVGFYARLRSVYDQIEAPLEIHHGVCHREVVYQEPEEIIEVDGDSLNLARKFLVMRWKRQSNDWIICMACADVEAAGVMHRQTSGLVIARLVDRGARFDPGMLDRNARLKGFVFEGTMMFEGNTTSKLTCSIPNVIFDDRAKYANWLLNGCETVETELKAARV